MVDRGLDTQRQPANRIPIALYAMLVYSKLVVSLNVVVSFRRLCECFGCTSAFCLISISFNSEHLNIYYMVGNIVYGLCALSCWLCVVGKTLTPPFAYVLSAHRTSSVWKCHSLLLSHTL